MKKYLVQYKPFLLFISIFFATYIFLTLVYKSYLNLFEESEVDGITNLVGDHVKYIMQLFGADIRIEKNVSESFLEVWYNNVYFVRIVEGCNAVSIVILFISFVISFSGKWKSTVFFILFGVFFIYILNVIRIALLTVLLFRFPENQQFLHGVLFPLIIYGVVFILWIIWVNKFSKYAK
ncbi:exosortase family protein XrtF [Flavobacterium sp. Fl-77]|uniref:Exosortase family protein XrtF n=1 Tax=Flavobacterium flavipigmentatum TaxID=2893884 RepID=A0AAJ2VX76_9FLAO|nr:MULTISPECIES: exosortase family protein XrtF [unclassified Flavobacterium]MDX6181334.1 exosortase family protein XrtF [Flavobacterium sp. Fl-33]MDX6184935.1 exosortase family protein XrtF [Flavobacterium sp. Fl-77]UFH40027.1 exosortase family protein XrtF [Flavobacterium sp. F-70]